MQDPATLSMLFSPFDSESDASQGSPLTAENAAGPFGPFESACGAAEGTYRTGGDQVYHQAGQLDSSYKSQDEIIRQVKECFTEVRRVLSTSLTASIEPMAYLSCYWMKRTPDRSSKKTLPQGTQPCARAGSLTLFNTGKHMRIP